MLLLTRIARLKPLEAIQRRARDDRTSVSWILNDFDTDRAGNMAIGRSAALVFISSDSGEDYITVDGNEGDRCAAPMSLSTTI
jgi:beta-glucosidase